MSFRGQIIERSGFTVTARVEGFGTTWLQPAQVTSIAVSIWDMVANEQEGTTFAPPVASVVYASLMSWATDKIGHNVAIPIPGSYIPHAGSFRVEVRIVPAVGEPFYLPPWELTAAEILSS